MVDFTNIGFSLYPFTPNTAAPIVMAILFLLTVLTHIVQTTHYASWKLTGSLPWAGILFIAGFIMRTISIHSPQNLGDYIATTVLLIAAPPVYALTNYLMLGRTLFYVPYLSPIHPGRVISTFVGLDVLVEALTASGAAKIANVSNDAAEHQLGVNLVRASLLLQVVLFLGFTALEVLFHVRCIRAGVMTKKLTTVVALLYTSSALILIRNVYRVIEQWGGGATDYLQEHEAFFYVFDAALMLVNSVVLNVWHPARFLPKDNKVYLRKEGGEAVGPGWVDHRPWYVTVIDPFDIVGLVSGMDRKTRFWEEEEREGGVVEPELKEQQAVTVESELKA